MTLLDTWSSFLLAFVIFIVSEIFIRNFYTEVFCSSSYWPWEIIVEAREIDACYFDRRTRWTLLAFIMEKKYFSKKPSCTRHHSTCAQTRYVHFSWIFWERPWVHNQGSFFESCSQTPIGFPYCRHTRRNTWLSLSSLWNKINSIKLFIVSKFI